MMHIEYKVKLAGQRKLLPSVIGDMQVKTDIATYSGPTYIGIRSAKHLMLSAHNDLTDMK